MPVSIARVDVAGNLETCAYFNSELISYEDAFKRQIEAGKNLGSPTATAQQSNVSISGSGVDLRVLVGIGLFALIAIWRSRN